jgi:hypothetical protein
MDNLQSPPHLTIQGDRFGFDLWRLPYHPYEALKERSFQVDIDDDIMSYLFRKEYNKGDRLSLPKLLVTLQTLFGESSTHMDSSCQTFAFHFFLCLRKNGKNLPYLLLISDYQGNLLFRLHRVIDHEKFFRFCLSSRQKEITNELYLEDIAYLVYGLWMELTTVGNAICKADIANQNLQPFFRTLSFVNLIYGYADGEFFEQTMNDQEQYTEVVTELEKKYPQQGIPLSHDLQETQRILQNTLQVGSLP